MKLSTKINRYLNGHKTIISSILLMVVQSDYVSGLIPNQDLYNLIYAIAGLLFAGSLTHHVSKIKKQNKQS